MLAVTFETRLRHVDRTYRWRNERLCREAIFDILLGQDVLGLVEPRPGRIEVGIAYNVRSHAFFHKDPEPALCLAGRPTPNSPRSALELSTVRHAGGPKSSTSISGNRLLLPEPPEPGREIEFRPRGCCGLLPDTGPDG
jgi:hypothetical protein